MDFIGDKEYWKNKFKSRDDRLLEPEALLIQNINYFKKGSVLDIACGDGRNAIFMLQNGFEVTGIDFSDAALERLKKFAAKDELKVSTKKVDLTSDSALDDLGVFDNVLINHYKLSKENISKLGKHISEGGILFVCGFGHKHKVDSKIRKEDLIRNEDFDEVRHSFKLLKYIENEDNRGFFVGYVFKKKRLG